MQRVETNTQKFLDIGKDLCGSQGVMQGSIQGFLDDLNHPNSPSTGTTLKQEIQSYTDAITKLTELSKSSWVKTGNSPEILEKINLAKQQLEACQKDLMDFVNGDEKDQSLLTKANSNFNDAWDSALYAGMNYKPK